MKRRYSPKLIAECIACFRDEDGIDITEDKAETYLRGLGGLFRAFAMSEAAARAALAAEPQPPQVSVTPVERCRMHHD